MGFRTAAVVVPTCFLLGVLLTGLASADWPILYSGRAITPADIDRAETYYVTLWHAPGAVPALLHAMVAVALLALSAKLALKKETNYFFDGSSLALMIVALSLYSSVSIPNLRLIAKAPLEDQVNSLGGRLRRWLNQPMPSAEEIKSGPEPLTAATRQEVISLLCASNNLMIAALVGVVLFQGAQTYAQWQLDKEIKAARDATKVQKAQ